MLWDVTPAAGAAADDDADRSGETASVADTVRD